MRHPHPRGKMPGHFGIWAGDSLWGFEGAADCDSVLLLQGQLRLLWVVTGAWDAEGGRLPQDSRWAPGSLLGSIPPLSPL